MSRTILVIDDDEAVRDSIAEMLTTAGYDVLQAADGFAGLALFEKRHPDLILTDIVMPGSEGIEIILRIRETSPATRIIAMSGGGRLKGEFYLDLARRIGADETIDKPFSSEALMAAVTRCLPAG